MRKEVTRIIFVKLIWRSAKYNDRCIWTDLFQPWGIVPLGCIKPKSEWKSLKSAAIVGLYLYILSPCEMLSEFSDEIFPSREVDELWTLTGCKRLCDSDNSEESQIHWRQICRDVCRYRQVGVHRLIVYMNSGHLIR